MSAFSSDIAYWLLEARNDSSGEKEFSQQNVNENCYDERNSFPSMASITINQTKDDKNHTRINRRAKAIA